LRAARKKITSPDLLLGESASSTVFTVWQFVLIAAALLALALMIVVAAVARSRRSRTPADEYLRNVNGIRLDTHRQITPRYTRQFGEPQGYEGPPGAPGM
jgi:hypothetical protein